MKEKKQWQKPELVVIVRTNAEEAVLLTCKISGFSGPEVGASACRLGCEFCFADEVS